MESVNDVVDGILTEVDHIQKYGFWDDIDGDESLFPSTIPVGNGQCIRSTSILESLIWRLSSALHREQSGERRGFDKKDLRDAVRVSLGTIMGSEGWEASTTERSQNLLASIRAHIAKLSLLERKRTYVFGCDLFSSDLGDLRLGPVLMQPRDSWLLKLQKDGRLGSVTAERIRRRWNKTKFREIKNNSEADIENEIINLIGDHRYVCSVILKGFSDSIGLDRALLATKIALAAIAIRWQSPSRALKDFNISYSAEMFQQRYIIFGDKTGITSFSGKSRSPNGKYVDKQEWANILATEKASFQFFSKILEWTLNRNADRYNSEIFDAFAQSSFWFHEACREENSMVSVVKFAASLDSLVGGRGYYEIVKLFGLRAGITPADIIFSDGSTLKNSIELIYNTGRSKIVHGSTNKFKYDWSVEKSKAEILAKICLLACIDWAAESEGPIDIKQMLA